MNEARQHLGGIARSGSLNLLGAVIAAISSFLLVVIVTNSLNRELAGQFFSGTSVFMMALALCILGTDAGIGRLTSVHLVAGNPDAARACWWSAIRVTSAVSAVVATLAVVFRDSLVDLLGLHDPDASTMLAILAIGLPPATLASVCLSSTRSLAIMRPNVLIDKVLRAAGQTALAGGALLFGGRLVALGFAWSIPYVISAVLAFIVMRRMMTRRLTSVDQPIEDTRRLARREFWHFTWPRSVAQISQMVIQRADIVIIAAVISPAAAAVYTAATRFVALGQFGNQAIQQSIQPRFAHLLSSGEDAVLAHVYKISTTWSILISWPIYLAIGCAPTLYLQIFGEGYSTNGVPVVIVMAIAMMIGVASGPVDTMLLMSGRSGLSLTNSLCALAVNLTLCFTLIPTIGILGAACAWAAAVIVRNILGFVQVRRATGLSPFALSTVIAGSTTALCFGVPIAALSLSGHLTLLRYVMALLGASALFAAILWTQRGVLELTALKAIATRRNGRGGR